MIEIAPEEYHKDLTIDEAIMYCFSLNIDGKIGWRLPSTGEYHEYSHHLFCWYQLDIENKEEWEDEAMPTIPVRDLKDD